MGVNGLWTVVAPTARPTKLETLNRKRLAVDASIWIYQFLKAVRDKEGNALRNSHVVGFFRRICKLLYFGIKPIFVFDGGAPILKRETVRSRARRREGRREDAVRTAGKLLALQVAKAAEDEEKRRKEVRERTPLEEELPPDQELVYVEEIGMTQKEKEVGRGFKKKDQYHLPNLDVSMESLGAPNDPRIMSQAELEEYARQFHRGEDINLYDFSKIDFESPFFLSLPPGDRYNILNAARLRSRLRMGLSKEQLDGMFPDRLAFSKFQIERVRERNELTQRLMHINGMSEDSWDQGGRIVGEKGKEYVLVKNEGVEGGWALGVVSNRAGRKREEAIDLDEDGQSDNVASESEGGEFEDVAVEGLNRLHKSMRRKETREVDYDISYDQAAAQIARKRQAVYSGRKRAAEEAKETLIDTAETKTITPIAEDLFVPDDDGSQADSDLFEDVNMTTSYDDDDDLQRAIAMSLEQPAAQSATGDLDEGNDASEDDGVDLRAALAESRRSKYQPKTKIRARSPGMSGFDGPLPFESLNLGQSLLGKKKLQKTEESMSGGFDRQIPDLDTEKRNKSRPLPAWFDSAPTENDSRKWNESRDEPRPPLSQVPTGIPASPKEVIDLETEDTGEQLHNKTRGRTGESVTLYEPAEDEQMDVDDHLVSDEVQDEFHEEEKQKAAEGREARYELARQIAEETKTKDQDITQPKSHPPDIEQEVRSSKPPIPSGEGSPASERVDWSDSEASLASKSDPVALDGETASPSRVENSPQSEEGDFEDVAIDMPLPQTEMSIETTDVPGGDYLTAAPETAQDGQGRQESLEDYISDSDEELMRQLAIEAEEHARFASELNTNKPAAEARRDYENELKQLRSQQKRDRRDADEVTQAMVQECQALLGLFGLPYITAPMEAEAQCAELVHLGLVDGIVTDDSDIFLFGGTRVYKNMFNAAKFVECYVTSDLEKEYALDRRKLIRFAHLLGSDYTEGIPGIGPVTALEIISDFDTLEEFKDWCSNVQLGRPQDLENQLTTPFRRKFKRTVQKKLFLPTTFPDLRVDQAYLTPDVDADPEEFQWGVPDLEKLRRFLMATIGWSQERTDEILVPVVRDINKREQEGTQANITHFFTGGVGVGVKEGTAPRNRTGKESGRMKNAYTRLRGEARKRQMDDDDDDTHEAGGEESEVESIPRRKNRKVKR